MCRACHTVAALQEKSMAPKRVLRDHHCCILLRAPAGLLPAGNCAGFFRRTGYRLNRFREEE
jgi:hypothetical protein